MSRNTLFEYAEDILNSSGFTRMPRQLAIDLAPNVDLYDRVCIHIGTIDAEIRTLISAALDTVSGLDEEIRALKAKNAKLEAELKGWEESMAGDYIKANDEWRDEGKRLRNLLDRCVYFLRMLTRSGIPDPDDRRSLQELREAMDVRL